ncbi:hypothetical protein JHK85_057612 [Glycine max]|nr:hypothetical protein JHK85_057612 [Glycine max]
MKGKRFLSVPVLAVFLLMLFVYYSSIFVFLQDWLGLQSSPGTLNAFLFSLFASLSLFSFFSCVLTDPGHVPSSYAPDVEFSKDVIFFHISIMDSLAFCSPRIVIFYGQGFKCFASTLSEVADVFMSYDRLRMQNRRNVTSALHTSLPGPIIVEFAEGVTVGSGVAEIDGCNTGKIARPWRLMVLVQRLCDRNPEVLYGTMVVGLTITLLTLFGWHVYLILHNMTTIEYYEGNRAKWLAMRSGQSYRHPFNIGAYKNITLVLGPNMLKWLCPTAVSHLKDGVSFPTLRDNS